MCCFKQKTEYEMRISDGSSDVCSSDLRDRRLLSQCDASRLRPARAVHDGGRQRGRRGRRPGGLDRRGDDEQVVARRDALWLSVVDPFARHLRSEEHTSELQSLMRNSYAVFCLKKKNK